MDESIASALDVASTLSLFLFLYSPLSFCGSTCSDLARPESSDCCPSPSISQPCPCHYYHSCLATKVGERVVANSSTTSSSNSSSRYLKRLFPCCAIAIAIASQLHPIKRCHRWQLQTAFSFLFPSHARHANLFFPLYSLHFKLVHIWHFNW